MTQPIPPGPPAVAPSLVRRRREAIEVAAHVAAPRERPRETGPAVMRARLQRATHRADVPPAALQRRLAAQGCAQGAA